MIIGVGELGVECPVDSRLGLGFYPLQARLLGAEVSMMPFLSEPQRHRVTAHQKMHGPHGGRPAAEVDMSDILAIRLMTSLQRLCAVVGFGRNSRPQPSGDLPCDAQPPISSRCATERIAADDIDHPADLGTPPFFLAELILKPGAATAMAPAPTDAPTGRRRPLQPSRSTAPR